MAADLGGGIKLFFQLGNYFIMDSEQLVSNPFQELQQEAVNEAAANGNKKNSMTEKLTSVKNNVCENHFQMAKTSLERQQTSKLKQLHDHANRLRHEVKLLDLDRQRHTVEVRKRLEPGKDYSYDEVQIHNTERRLGANIASFYLDKKLKYPMRLRSTKDIRVTPTVSKARAIIRTSEVNKALEEEVCFSRQERAQTAKTTASSVGHISTNSATTAFRRRGSRSAPLHTSRTTRSAGNGSKATLFPAISSTENGNNNNNNNGNRNNNRRAVLTRSKTFTKDGGGSVTGGSEKDHQNQNQHVKFAFENPLKILASSEESANMFARSCSYYPGSTRAVNFGADSSDDEDALSEHEMIDLRAILFPDDNKSGTPAGGPTHFSLSQHQIWALRKAQGPAPKLSTTQKEEEANVMDAKINKFLERLALARLKKRRRHGYDSDSSEEDDDQNNIDRDNNYNNNQANSTFQKTLTKSSGTSTSNTDSNTFTNNKSSNNNMGTNTETTTTPLGVDSNNNNIQSKNATPQTITATTKSITAQNNNNNNWQHNNNDNDSDDDNAHHHPEHTPNSAGSPRKQQQYSWRCIRGKQTDGQLRGTYRTEDLVIQALTGVPISNAIHAHVPMHSASRAMRHTATFKMHKIVERLIHERTKYERHQVEEIKRQQMESTSAEPAETGGLSSTTNTAGGGNLSRRVSRATLPNQLSTR